MIVICGSEYKQSKSWLKEDIKVYPILPSFSVLNILRRIRTVKRIRKVVECNQVGIIHSMYAVPNALWGDSVSVGNHIVTTRGSDILVDYLKTYHSPIGFRERVSFWRMRNSINKALNNAAFITSTSLGQKNEIEKIISDTGKLFVVRTGVDTNQFSSKSSVLESGNKLMIFSPRSMKSIYNIELLISGVNCFIESMGKSSLDVELLIVDDMPNSSYSREIHEFIRAGAHNHFVTILPTLTQIEMRGCYQNCDLVVMIPKSDGTPVSAIEAMLSKKPLILGDLDYDEDLFNRNTVWKINGFSKEAIKDSIVELRMDRTLLQSKVENAYWVAYNKVSLQNSLIEIEGLYNRINENSGNQGGQQR